MRPTLLIALMPLMLSLAACSRHGVRDVAENRHQVRVCSEYGVTNPQVGALQAAKRYCARSQESAAIVRMDDVSCPNQTAGLMTVFYCR